MAKLLVRCAHLLGTCLALGVVALTDAGWIDAVQTTLSGLSDVGACAPTCETRGKRPPEPLSMRTRDLRQSVRRR